MPRNGRRRCARNSKRTEKPGPGGDDVAGNADAEAEPNKVEGGEGEAISKREGRVKGVEWGRIGRSRDRTDGRKDRTTELQGLGW